MAVDENFPFLKTTFGKLSVGVIITFFLLMPVSMIENLVMERQDLHDQMVYDISRDWGKEQTLNGPYLEVPYEYYVRKAGEAPGVKTLVRNVAVFLPEDLNIKGDVKHYFKKRGIYKFLVYQGKINISGSFVKPDLEHIQRVDKNLNFDMLDWKNAKIRFYSTDIKGVTNKVSINWKNKPYPVIPDADLDKKDNYKGFYAEVNFESIQGGKFDFALQINGSRELNFIPLGKYSKINISADWPSPKFWGSYLPKNHHITQDGFSSKWAVSQFNRAFSQQWRFSAAPDLDKFVFGVKLLEPVDKYHKSMRAVKYAVLFIVLSFIALFFVEMFTNSKNNVLQYILTGLALVLFYSILLSLTEQMSFDWAYLISAAAIIGLISVYNYSLTKMFKSTLILFLLWSVLYGFLFFILQLEELALLAGNIGLFVILAIIMFATKKLSVKSIIKKTPPSEDKTVIDRGDSL